MSIGYLTAFLGGALSFLAPCVLPLIPGYLSFITGLSSVELGGRTSLRVVMVPALLFVAGFTVAFTFLGASAGFASQALRPFLAAYGEVVTVVAGIVVALMGVLLTGVIKVPWLYAEARVDLAAAKRFGRAASFFMGLAFGFGWTPCVGPILAVILGLAAETGDTLRAASMLGAYSLGLGLPFLLTAAFFGSLRSTLGWFNRHSHRIAQVSGGILVVMGVLMASGQMGAISRALVKVFPFLAGLG